MYRQDILWIFFFTMCGVTPVILAQNVFHCFNLQYSGPIEDVIKMKPTGLVEKTSDAANAGRQFAIVLGANVLGQIPVAGAILGATFEGIAELFGGGGLDPEDVYNSLTEEINQLKEYMDQEISEAKLDYIKKIFGTSNGGILSYSMHCQKTYKNDAEDMAPCLENLHSMLTTQYHFFLPSDSKVSSYEFSLPLFRMYGQLFVDTLLEQIVAARTRGKESQAAAFADTLINKVEAFKKHYEESVEKIVFLHYKPHIMPENNGNCATNTGVSMCVCSIAIGPSKFDEAEIEKEGESIKNFCIGLYYSSGNPCGLAKQNYIQRYARKHVEAVVTYWKKQLGDIVDTWVKTAEELKPLKANLKRYKMYTYCYYYYCCCCCCCYCYYYYYYYYYYY